MGTGSSAFLLRRSIRQINDERMMLLAGASCVIFGWWACASPVAERRFCAVGVDMACPNAMVRFVNWCDPNGYGGTPSIAGTAVRSAGRRNRLIQTAGLPREQALWASAGESRTALSWGSRRTSDGFAVPIIDLARSPGDERVFPVLAEVRTVLAGVRIVADLRASLSAEGEVAQLPLRRIDDLVSGARTGRGQDYVAGAYRELPVVVAQGAFSFEYDEELFFRIVQMVGPRPLPGLEHHEGAPNLAGAELRSDSSQHRGEVPGLPVLLERELGEIDNRGILFHREDLFR